MSTVALKMSPLPPIKIPEPKPIKSRSRRIICGRKIICLDQLYGWRGMDTGYYGSDKSDDEPDIVDELNIFTANDEDERERLEALRTEAEQRLKKVQEARPNFNILTDRPPTPDFSVTYISTSYTASEQTANEDLCPQLMTAIEDDTATATDGTDMIVHIEGDGNNESGVAEPMELDESTYLRGVTAIQQIQNTNDQKDDSVNLTYTIEKNENSSNSFVTGAEGVDEEAGSVLEIRLDGTFIVEKLPQSEDGTVFPVQANDQKEHRSVSVIGCGHINETAKTPLNEIPRNEMREIAGHSTMETAAPSSVLGERMLALGSNKFGFPAPLQTTFDLSRIEKVSLSGTERTDSPATSVPSRILRSNLLEKMGGADAAPKTPSRTAERTVVSFKTPKRTGTGLERTNLGSQMAYATPVFKKGFVAPTPTRGTSTPVGGCERVCPRYEAHHAALTNHATQTGSCNTTPLRNRSMIRNDLTPEHRVLSYSASRNPHASTTTGKTLSMRADTPSHIPVPSSAFKAISQYGSPLPSAMRSSMVDYEMTPRSHGDVNKATPIRQSRVMAVNQSTGYPMSPLRTSLQRSMTRFAFEHIKSGGTPRPTSSTQRYISRIESDNVSQMQPRTPVAKPDLSQMLVENVMRSGPAYRRRPRPTKLLPAIGNLQFESIAEKSDLSSRSISDTSATKQTQKTEQGESLDATRLVVIDSFDGDEVENLAESAGNLNITGNESKQSEDFDSTVHHGQKQSKGLCFDTVNYCGSRRVLSILNESIVSLNTPGKEDQLEAAEISPETTDTPPIHIVAAKDEHKQIAVLCPRKIVRSPFVPVHAEESEHGLRRSTRNRIAPVRHWLGEKPLYQRETGDLVGVKEAVITDSLYVKYNTTDMGEVIERQKKEQKQRARVRRLRKYTRRAVSEENAGRRK